MEYPRTKQLEAIFKGTANRRRIAIIRTLAKEGELSVGDVAKEIRLSFTATSKHLNMLYKLDFLERRQKELVVYYRIGDYATPFMKYLISTISHSRAVPVRSFTRRRE